MRGACIGIIKASKSPAFPVNSYAVGYPGWSELSIVKAAHLEKATLPSNGQLTDLLGVLGMTGLTAYFGLLDVGKVKKGDFVVVSGAAGATGSVAGQIAKLQGATVLGLAGSEDKCKWLVEELGFDTALNYKDKDFVSKFRAATKPLIDVYFDNVGGEILDLCLARAKKNARFVICGAISQYNSKDVKGPKNYLMIISMRIRMEGFIVMDYADRYDEGRKELAKWLSEGKIKRKETIVKGGLRAAERALLGLYKGTNTGKSSEISNYRSNKSKASYWLKSHQNGRQGCNKAESKVTAQCNSANLGTIRQFSSGPKLNLLLLLCVFNLSGSLRRS